MDREYKCSKCSIVFKRVHNLRKHALELHPGFEDEIAPLKKALKTFDFKCTDCARQFSDKKNLKYHYNKIHHDSMLARKHITKVKCTLCESTVVKSTFENHLHTLHGIRLGKEHLQFPTYSDCCAWIKTCEQNSFVRFVKASGSKCNTKGVQVVTFYCHRSGYYRSTGVGLRKIKNQGSNKINAYCPATIRIVIERDGKCKVTFVKTHLGHENELHHLTLTKAQRDLIAAKIAAKVPFDDIIEEVQHSSNEEFRRINLLTKHDLFNIKQAYNLREDCGNSKRDSTPVAEYKKFEGVTNFEILVCEENSEMVDMADDSSREEQSCNLLNVSCIEDNVGVVNIPLVEEHNVSLEERKEKILNYLVEILNAASSHADLDIIENVLSTIKVVE